MVALAYGLACSQAHAQVHSVASTDGMPGGEHEAASKTRQACELDWTGGVRGMGVDGACYQSTLKLGAGIVV